MLHFLFPSLVLLLLPSLLSCLSHPGALAYTLVDDFSGIEFFDEWDFYGGVDNLTMGDVNWLTESDAFSQQLALVNQAGNVIIKVDNFTPVSPGQKRNSVRITTRKTYAMGTLWIVDAVHMPFGCSVWPSIWTFGPAWPAGGEIDIIEGINMMPTNQYALHTTEGCLHTTPTTQIGTSSLTDCAEAAGCLVTETKPNSYGPGFAAAGGGVYAAQFDYTGCAVLSSLIRPTHVTLIRDSSLWFWSRANVPPSIVHATSTSGMDLADWGPPSAAYVNTSCAIEQFFSPQNLVIDITLCGNWAGLPATYAETCAHTGPSGTCYTDNVVGNGANYDDAYFEIRSVRAYTTAAATPTAVAALGQGKTNRAGMMGPGVSWLTGCVVSFLVAVLTI
ncbi:unnamed protein product [Mycena citricolor]|uniref:GH16 domain-containing protein n=1 Tax=Mycena citricolor TaxID=2018698 RepID=A0AAD2HAJ9_9AGAR|nr:unnamed protein product [Mycena citricolor]